jgi:hypothetical protein
LAFWSKSKLPWLVVRAAGNLIRPAKERVAI